MLAQETMVMNTPEFPKFPSTPEEIKAASEKVMNFWIGACSPMWVPFFAASSFGLSTWMMSGALAKGMDGESPYSHLPKGFTDAMSMHYSWYKAEENAAHIMEEVKDAAKVPMQMALEAEDAFIDAIKDGKDMATKTSDAVTEATKANLEAVEDVQAKAAEIVEDTQSAVMASVEDGKAAVSETVEAATDAAPAAGDLPEMVVEPAFQPVAKPVNKKKSAPKKPD